eukprot:COSAG01_NODE_4900_length_4642_cov_34.906229_2_plen_106_part_00
MAEETDLKPLVYHYLLANGWAKAAKALAKEIGKVSTGRCFVGSPQHRRPGVSPAPVWTNVTRLASGCQLIHTAQTHALVRWIAVRCRATRTRSHPVDCMAGVLHA